VMNAKTTARSKRGAAIPRALLDANRSIDLIPP
jgi:hypothetical protein